MKIVGAIMRIFSYAFHILLALFLLGISSLALSSGAHNLKIGILPWQEATLTYVLFCCSLAGIAFALLACFGFVRVLFFVWSLAVVVMLVRGYVFSPFSFASSTGMWTALCLTLSAMLAAAGAWSAYRSRPN